MKTKPIGLVIFAGVVLATAVAFAAQPTADVTTTLGNAGNATRTYRAAAVEIVRDLSDEDNTRISFPVVSDTAIGDETVRKNEPSVTRIFGVVKTQTTTITDPVTGKEITISAAGVQIALREFFIAWLTEDRKPLAAP